MPLTLAELLVPKTSDAILASLLAKLAAKGFPTTSWPKGGASHTLVAAIAEIVADEQAFAVRIAKGALLEEAEGDQLTLYCRSNMDTERKAATFADHTVTLACSGSAGPYTILAGQLIGKDAAGRIFRNLAGGSLPTSGTLALTFRAESPGADFNTTIVSLGTPLPGVTIQSSVLAASGANEESDPELRTRAKLKWSELGLAPTDATYRKYALDADIDVRRARAVEDFPGPGKVKIYIARQDGTATGPGVGTDEETVQAYVDARRPLCVQVDVEPATVSNVTVTATVRIRAADLANAQASVNTKLLELFRTVEIGGASASDDATLYRAELIEVLMALPGAKNATLSAPAADVVLTQGQVAILSGFNPLTSITWVTF